jgi:hypothetical protein
MGCSGVTFELLQSVQGVSAADRNDALFPWRALSSGVPAWLLPEHFHKTQVIL